MGFIIACIYSSAIFIAFVLAVFYTVWHKKHHTIDASKNKKNNKINVLKNFKIVNNFSERMARF